jgi:hypothetical protein
MVFIYVLELENNKYYIGKSSNPKNRIKKHFSNNGSVWTIMHKPIKVVEIISNCDIYDEDKITLKYMDKYGIGNVRGGYFSQATLSSVQLHFLIQLLRSANDKCLCCGSKGHFASECKGEIKKQDKPLDQIQDQTHAKQNNFVTSLIYLFNIIDEFINPNI